MAGDTRRPVTPGLRYSMAVIGACMLAATVSMAAPDPSSARGATAPPPSATDALAGGGKGDVAGQAGPDGRPEKSRTAGPDERTCRGDAVKLLRDLRVTGASVPVVFSRYARVPSAGPMEVVVAGDGFDPDVVSGYRVVFGYGDKPDAESVATVDGLDVAVTGVSAEYFPKGSKPLGDKARLLSFDAPANLGGRLWDTGTMTVFGCGPTGSVVFVANSPVTFSDRLACLALTVALAALLYLAAAVGVARWERPRRVDGIPLGWQRYLDPVVLSSGPNGAGSISRLQILFFSMLVFSLLFYLLLRVGLLSDMSATILELLGISAVGAATSKATDVTRNRLHFENWAWLVKRKWLPEFGMLSITVARWRDLVTADDGFDVYHFQMLIFSLVVGLALLQVGFADLGTFEIPESLLGVLGLSQVVYVGGKLVAQPSCTNLDAAVTELRKREGAALAAPARPASLVATVPASLPLASQSATASASLSPIEAFDQQLSLTRTMFESVFRTLPSDAVLVPSVA